MRKKNINSIQQANDLKALFDNSDTYNKVLWLRLYQVYPKYQYDPVNGFTKAETFNDYVAYLDKWLKDLINEVMRGYASSTGSYGGSAELMASNFNPAFKKATGYDTYTDFKNSGKITPDMVRIAGFYEDYPIKEIAKKPTETTVSSTALATTGTTETADPKNNLKYILIGATLLIAIVVYNNR
jgi:hypothetical protein